VRSVDATLSAYERDRDRAGFLLAGALAYRLFLWLLPFTLLIGGALGFLEASDHDSPSDLADNLGVVGLASKSVSEADRRFYARPVHRAPHRDPGPVPGEPRRAALGRALRDRVIPAGRLGRKPLAVLGSLGVIAAFFTVTFVATAIRQESPGPGVIATVLIGIAYVWLAFLVLWMLPRPSVHWPALLPGAIAIGLGLQAIHLVSVYFISYRISSSSETYGALGVAAAILLSLFLIGRLFVAAVILNTTLCEAQSARHDEATGGQSPNRGDAT
jgi:uncharacterized BrkB/YihY/UPF0761 family membrane protein